MLFEPSPLSLVNATDVESCRLHKPVPASGGNELISGTNGSSLVKEYIGAVVLCAQDVEEVGATHRIGFKHHILLECMLVSQGIHISSSGVLLYVRAAEFRAVFRMRGAKCASLTPPVMTSDSAHCFQV